MRKYLLIAYILILIILAIPSATIIFVNNPTFFFGIELSVDIILITGVILYTIGIRTHWWTAFVFIAILGEIFLLGGVSPTEYIEAIFWVVILLPAIYMNFKVSNIVRQTAKI
jgi:hypothetical protein